MTRKKKANDSSIDETSPDTTSPEASTTDEDALPPTEDDATVDITAPVPAEAPVEAPLPQSSEEDLLRAQVERLLHDRDDAAAALVACHDVVLAREALIADLEGHVMTLANDRGALQLALNVATDEVVSLHAALDDKAAKHLFQVVGRVVAGQRHPARHYVVARDVTEATAIATGRGKIAVADIHTVVASVPDLIF